MLKQTFQFPSFKDLAAFSKTLSTGYLINTNLLTITASFEEHHHTTAQKLNGMLVVTTEKVFAYDPVASSLC